MALTSLYRGVLPLPHPAFVDFSSAEGKRLFTQSLHAGYMNCYFLLAPHFLTQSTGDMCGPANLVLVLNALLVDPVVECKLEWRWFEETMLRCCRQCKEVPVLGMTIGEFSRFANYHGLHAQVFHADDENSESDFRDAIKSCTKRDDVVMVVNYGRIPMMQRGNGHYTTIGGYNEESDKVLILDVARYKYPAHWAPVSMLYEASKDADTETGLPRGYILLKRLEDAASTTLFSIPDVMKSFDAEFIRSDAWSFINQWREFLARPENSHTMDEYASRDFMSYGTSSLIHFLTDDNKAISVIRTKPVCGGQATPDNDQHMANIQDAILHDMKTCRFYSVIKSVTDEFEIHHPTTHSRLKYSYSSGDTSEFNGSVRVEDYLFVFMMAWPYNRDRNTVGNSLWVLLGGDLSENCGEHFRNEIHILKENFNYLANMWIEGVDFSCEKCSADH